MITIRDEDQSRETKRSVCLSHAVDLFDFRDAEPGTLLILFAG